MSKKNGDYSRRRSGPGYGKHGRGFSNKDYNGGKKHKKGKNVFNIGKTYDVDRVVKVLSTPGEAYINPDRKKKKEGKLEKKVKNG